MWIVGRSVREDRVLFLQQKAITAQWKRWLPSDTVNKPINNRSHFHKIIVGHWNLISKNQLQQIQAVLCTQLHDAYYILDYMSCWFASELFREAFQISMWYLIEFIKLQGPSLNSTRYQVTMRLPAITCKHQSSTQVIAFGNVCIELDWPILTNQYWCTRLYINTEVIHKEDNHQHIITSGTVYSFTLHLHNIGKPSLWWS